MSENPELHIDDGSERTVTIEKPQVVIGSGSGCDVVIQDPKCSERHCRLEKTSEGWVILDLESRHGTSVNGSFTNKFRLKSGDRIEIGDAEIVIRMGEGKDVALGQPGKKDHSFAPSGRSRPSKPSSASKKVSTKRYSGLTFYVLLFVMVLIGGGIAYYMVSQNRSEIRASREAFQEGCRLYEEGNYEKAISAYRNVSGSKTPELHRIAQQAIKRARVLKRQEKEITVRRETEKAFRNLIDETLTTEVESEDDEQDSETFKEHLDGLPEQYKDQTWFTHYQRVREELNKRFQEDVKAGQNAQKARRKWEKVKSRARSLRDSNKYGPAADRIIRFKFIHPNSGLDQKINIELRKIRSNARIHLNSEKNQIDQLLNNGNDEMVENTLEELKTGFYSYFDPLSPLYVEVIEKEIEVRGKLDNNSDSS